MRKVKADLHTSPVAHPISIPAEGDPSSVITFGNGGGRIGRVEGKEAGEGGRKKVSDVAAAAA